MKLNRLASLLLMISILGSITAPVFADEEIMVLPPINDQSANNVQYGGSTADAAQNSGYSPVLKGTVTTVPVGTSFEVVTSAPVSTKTMHVGELFSATLNQPITVGGDTVIPAGSEVLGQVTYSEDAGRVGKNAIMEIKFTGVKTPNGRKISMMGKIVTKDGSGKLKGGSLKGQLVKSTASVAIPTTSSLIVGAGIGSIAGEAGVGSAVGSSIGGIFGIGYMIYRKGKEVELPVGTKMTVTLEQPLTVGQ